MATNESSQRLADLEEQVAALQEQVRELQEESRRRPDRRPARPRRPRPPREPRKPLLPKVDVSTEELLKWSGIGLVLVAMALLFKYAIDEGWLTPFVRIAIGFAVGLILLGLGFRVHKARPRFGQVLQGGGLATFYITLFAAFQVLEVLPYEAAFIGMASTTVIGLTLALWQDDAGLAVFGLIGGLATPFALYTGSGDATALITYASLLLTATTAIYFWKGWRSMLYTTVIGGWAVFLMAASGPPTERPFEQNLAIQLSAVFGLLAFWVAPVVRSVFLKNDDDPLKRLESLESNGSGILTRLEWMFRNVVHFLVIVNPFIAFLLTGIAWKLSDQIDGLVLLGLSALFAGTAAYLNTFDRDRLAYTHWVSAAILATAGIALVLDGNFLMLALAAEVVGLHLLAVKLDDRWPRLGAHFLALVLFFWMAERLDYRADSPILVNLDAISDLFVLGCAVAASFAIKEHSTRVIYRVAGYVGFLAWLSRELSSLDNGQIYVTAAWSICGVLLVVFGLRRLDRDLRLAGLATLAVVVGKLFFVDLSELDPLWRILAFMGVGAGFLALGWFVPSLWKPMTSENVDEKRTDTPNE